MATGKTVLGGTTKTTVIKKVATGPSKTAVSNKKTTVEVPKFQKPVSKGPSTTKEIGKKGKVCSG